MKQVLVRLLANSGMQRDIIHGIARYSRLHGPWQILVADHTTDFGIFSRSDIDDPGIDGMLLTLGSQREVEEVQTLGKPFICMTHMHGVPMVSNNNDSVGHIGAEHLINQGYKHLIFAGPIVRDFQKQRLNAFTRFAQQKSVKVTILKVPTGNYREIGSLVNELKVLIDELEYPCALMADTDVQAHLIAQAATSQGIDIPNQLAVLGVENDQPICEITNPPLSSIVLDAERIGYEGAAMLDTIMAGKTLEQSSVFIPPLGVEQRQSTSALVIDDPQVAAALNFIHRNPGKALTTASVLSVVSIGRRMLERRFLEATGRTVFQEIRRVQLEHVKHLLRQTNWEIEMIARRSAFSSAKRLREVFRETFGQTPTRYRKQFLSTLKKID